MQCNVMWQWQWRHLSMAGSEHQCDAPRRAGRSDPRCGPEGEAVGVWPFWLAKLRAGALWITSAAASAAPNEPLATPTVVDAHSSLRMSATRACSHDIGAMPMHWGAKPKQGALRGVITSFDLDGRCSYAATHKFHSLSGVAFIGRGASSLIIRSWSCSGKALCVSLWLIWLGASAAR